MKYCKPESGCADLIANTLGCIKLLTTFFVLSMPSYANAADDGRLIESLQKYDKHAIKSLLAEKDVNANAKGVDGATALHWAVHWDDLEIAETLLKSGANPDTANEYGITPLHLACTNRNNQMVEKLLEAGAEANAASWTGETVLMTCSRTGTTRGVAALLASGADVNARENNRGQTALMWASASKHSEVVKLLLDYGVDITVKTEPMEKCTSCLDPSTSGGFTALLFVARSGDLESARYLIQAEVDPDESTKEFGNSLVIASASGHEDLALFLLENGADPASADENGVTALHYAISKGLSRMIGGVYDPLYRQRPENMPRLAKALLEAGANPDAQITKGFAIAPATRDMCESIAGMEGATPFFLAAASLDVPLLKLLAKYGADPKLGLSNHGSTPLIAAAQSSCTLANQQKVKDNSSQVKLSLEAVKTIVEMGVDVNSGGGVGYDVGRAGGGTALHVAAFAGATEVVKYLADQGATIDVRNNAGETPWSMAAGISPDLQLRGSYGVHEDTANLLLELGAIPITEDQIAPPED